jgi:flagellar basal-body rod protein FlgC
MSLFSIFDVAGSGMMAQSLRLNTTASNMANANSVSTDAAGAYRARHPVFSAMLEGLSADEAAAVGVRVNGIVEQQTPPTRLYDPGNPLANEEGYVFQSNVNTVEEMANMISASRSFQNNVEVMKTAKQMLTATLRLGE